MSVEKREEKNEEIPTVTESLGGSVFVSDQNGWLLARVCSVVCVCVCVCV